MLRKEARTRRLILRPLRLRDYPLWFDAWVNRLPPQNQWDTGPRPVKKCSKGEFQKLLARHQQEAKTDDSYWYGIFEKKSGQLVGTLDFDIFVRSTHQFANFGYVLYNKYWRNGYGQEAATAGLRIGFKQLKLNRLEAAINLDNKRSIRLVKAIGMRREGIKKRYWFEHGKWVDHLIYVANPEDVGLEPMKPLLRKS
jgi:[ribosomal protein S5]-alanine N-acetyltransferase